MFCVKFDGFEVRVCLLLKMKAWLVGSYRWNITIMAIEVQSTVRMHPHCMLYRP